MKIPINHSLKDRNLYSLGLDQDMYQLYLALVEIWREFCEKHSDLYHTTCDEYSLLLSSDIDQLDKILKKKEDVVGEISRLEQARKNIIEEVNSLLRGEEKINGVSDLLLFMKKFEQDNGERFLERYNLLLIDIIEKIQQQNKKNQILLNRSLIFLREMREEIMGRKSFNTYNALGMPSINSVPKT